MPGRPLIVVVAVLAAVVLTACGSQSVQVAQDDPTRDGAVLFAENCGGCHTLEAAGTQGSATDVGDRERTDGPSFDTRPEEADDVLYAIQNGGFSGAIMPENIVTGQEAQAVADFVEKYAGQNSESAGG